MQGKGLIKLFLVLTALICLLQIIYFLPTNKVEKNADEYANNIAATASELDRSAVRSQAKSDYLDSMSTETIFSIPGLTQYTYSDLKRQQLGLGLDLKGGMSVVLEVDLQELLTNLAGRNAKDADFIAAIEAAKIAQRSDQSDFVTLFASEFNRIAPNKKLSRIFEQSEMLGEDVNFNSTDGEVERVLRQKADETVSLTFKMLSERINRMGVVQPNISLDAARDLILVELPGIDNAARAEEMLTGTAKLEFWHAYRVSDAGILNSLRQADKRLKSMMGDTSAAAVDTFGVAIDDNGPLLRLLELNGQGGVFNYAQTVFGVADKNKRKAVDELLARPEIKNLFPKNMKFLWSYKPFQDYVTREKTNKYEMYAMKMQPGTSKAPMEGDVITQASQSQDPNTGEPEVMMSMNAKGAKKWAEMTEKAFKGDNLGTKRESAIALDDQVVTAPSLLNGAITQGSSSISGSFNIQEAVDVANVLEVGKLPADINIIQKSTVGPSLGKANIKKSMNSLIIGFGIVLLFMILYYMGGGVVSVLALLLNLFFIFGALSSFGTVLTLPGIAGIVLTIGMAVDANVIIFERIREELREGKTLVQSIADGFKNSYSAIIDANVTTILVAMVLAYFGLGPIKGFAVVLIIGVISSLFTAVLVGKLMIDSYVDGGNREISFWNGFSKNFLAKLNIDWIGKRKIAYTISSIIIIAGLASIFTRGWDLGVDFKGGHQFTVQFPTEMNAENDQITEALTTVFGGAPVVKQIDTDNSYSITTSYLIDDTSDDVDDQVSEALYNGLKAMTKTSVGYDAFKANPPVNQLGVTSYSKVGPTIADDIKKSSLYAGFFALLLIFLYIFLRFTKWQFSLGAVAALFHDTLITLGLFSLLKDIMPFSLEMDQAFIAAILTVIGYSINDTVIVFDRIREYLGIYTNKPKDEVFNMAINSTISRTVITSVTTLFVVLVLLIFGGSSIKGFAFAISIGIVIGTYSSVFIASPIVRDLTGDLTNVKVAGTDGK
jgi:SecD/SecF fusion protein